MARHPGKIKPSSGDSEMSSVSAGKANMDLLCDLKSKDFPYNGDEQVFSEKDALLSSLDMISSHDNNTSYIQGSTDRDPLLDLPTSHMELGNKTFEQVCQLFCHFLFV